MKIQNMLKTAAITFAASGIVCAFGASSAYAQSSVTSSRKTPVSTSVHLSGSCPKCDFSRRIMPGLSLQKSNFVGTNFSHSNLSGTNFDKANLDNTIFHKAYLMKVVGKNAQFNNAVFRGATLTESKLTDSHFVAADFLKADLTRGTFSRNNFTNVNMQSADAVKTIFIGANFTDARLAHSDFTGANFSHTNFTGTKFGDAQVGDANFEGAILSGARMANVEGLKQFQLDQACGTPQTRLPEGVTLKDCPVASILPVPSAMAKVSGSNYSADIAAESIAVPSIAVPSIAVPSIAAPMRRSPANISNQASSRNKMISVRASDIDEIMRGIDAAIGDLPMSSPTRVKLEKQRSKLEAVRARSDK